jgi:hypothetical protein
MPGNDTKAKTATPQPAGDATATALRDLAEQMKQLCSRFDAMDLRVSSLETQQASSSSTTPPSLGLPGSDSTVWPATS